MPLATVRSVKAAIRDSKDDLLTEAALYASREVAPDLSIKLKELLDQTLEHNGVGSAFFDAKVEVQTKVKRTNKGPEIELHAVVVGLGGGPHYVWHLIQFGIPSRVQRKTSPEIEASIPRTEPDTLGVAPYQPTGEVFRIPAGTPIKATPARNWYQTADKKLRDFLKKDYPDWEVSSSQVTKP